MASAPGDALRAQLQGHGVGTADVPSVQRLQPYRGVLLLAAPIHLQVLQLLQRRHRDTPPRELGTACTRRAAALYGLEAGGGVVAELRLLQPIGLLEGQAGAGPPGVAAVLRLGEGERDAMEWG